MCRLCLTERETSTLSSKYSLRGRFIQAVVDYTGDYPCVKCTQAFQIYMQRNPTSNEDVFIIKKLLSSVMKNYKGSEVTKSKIRLKNIINRKPNPMRRITTRENKGKDSFRVFFMDNGKPNARTFKVLYDAKEFRDNTKGYKNEKYNTNTKKRIV